MNNMTSTKKESLVELVGYKVNEPGKKSHQVDRTTLAVSNMPDGNTKNIGLENSIKESVEMENITSSISEGQNSDVQNNINSSNIHAILSPGEVETRVEKIPAWAVVESAGDGSGDGKDAGGGEPKRETWDKKVDFLLSMIGFAVDLANVWRFPYLCYKNGGGAFLIPYFTMLIFGAVPLFFMELILGQCHKKGCISVWKIAPIFKGIGICQSLIAFFVALYYNVIIAWSVYYLISSLTSTLPWTSCGNHWNTEKCSTSPDVFQYLPNMSSVSNDSMINFTAAVLIGGKKSKHYTTPTEEFFERRVLGLHLSKGLEEIGEPRWELVLCLIAVFIIIYFSIWKGVKTSGKVVWVTATMPYLVLTILFIRGLMLPGAGEGILYYITPRLERLGDSRVWIDAAVQIFYSSGAGFGVHMALASYNDLHHNCYRDCLITVCVNSFTSLYSGFVIFAYLGYMAASQSKNIASVAAEGPGLVFVVYPEAIATLPGSIFWSILFFVMLITLGLDSAMGGLEALLTGISDECQTMMRRFKYSREILTLFVVLGAFVFAMPNVTNGGMYLVTMWDTFAAGTSILFGVFAEVVAVAWFYGLEQFCEDINFILKFKPNFYWRVCWKFVSPMLLLVIIVSSFASYQPLHYSSYTLGDYVYPEWLNIMGWMVAVSSMSFIPLTALYKLLKTEGSFKKRLAINISPYWEQEEIKNGGKVTRFQRKHWLW